MDKIGRIQERMNECSIFVCNDEKKSIKSDKKIWENEKTWSVFHRTFVFSDFLSAVGRVIVLLIPVEGLLLSFSEENRQVSPWQPRMLTSSRLFDLFYWMTLRQLLQNSVWLLFNRRTRVSGWSAENRGVEVFRFSHRGSAEWHLKACLSAFVGTFGCWTGRQWLAEACLRNNL